ncbi:LamG domain-containing protein [Delftia tsuruhatensis]|uniref:LamG domain-containing protein n=1 Tax=Delftia tsuruhatensis TaxID=180282 RepID=UPI001F0B1171|nr:LamG domain-containing protein [Delftia tsuruhatensis]
MALARNTWTHVRACRAGDNLHLFQSGVLRATRAGYGAHSVGNGNPLFLGWAPNTTDFFEGRLDEFRVVRGVALSTASFTPPTASALPSRGPVRAAASRGLRPVRSSAVSAGHVLPLTLGRLARDIEVGGQGRIWGTTKIKGSPTNLPARARVVLLRQRDKMVVREAWSNAETGAFVFEGLDLRQQFVALAEDAAGNFRAVAAQRLMPGTMP